jgi:succinoglycan biosynthesis protein ExoA
VDVREPPKISICIVTGRRDAVLDACLRSLEQQEGAPPWELLVCAEGDPRVPDAVHDRLPEARVCSVDRGALPGAARNLLVEQARGDLLLFLDDDVTVAPDLLARLAAVAAAHPGCGVFGGPNDTPADSTRFQITQGAVLASIVGSGPVRRRYGAHPPGEADERFFILCNLAVRRDVMVAFPKELVCAEENAVLAELAHEHIRMFYDPELVVYHERRATLGGFARQMHKYGRGRGQLLAREPGTARPAYLVPSALLLYLVVTPLLAGLAGPVALLPLAAYLGAVGACAGWIAKTLRRAVDLPLAAWLILVLHACYGAGVLRGVLERRRSIAAPVAREWRGPTVSTAIGQEPDGSHADADDTVLGARPA